MASSNDSEAARSHVSPTSCTNGCGFYGNSMFSGMCSKCFKDQGNATSTASHSVAGESDSHEEKASPGSKARFTATSTCVSSQPALPSSPSGHNSPCAVEREMAAVESFDCVASASHTSPEEAINARSEMSTSEQDHANVPVVALAASDVVPASPRKKERCSLGTCRTKLLLSAIACHCGKKFCPAHRYPDEHECTFDYKTSGRANLSNSTTACVGSKVDKL